MDNIIYIDSYTGKLVSKDIYDRLPPSLRTTKKIPSEKELLQSIYKHFPFLKETSTRKLTTPTLKTQTAQSLNRLQRGLKQQTTNRQLNLRKVSNKSQLKTSQEVIEPFYDSNLAKPLDEVTEPILEIPTIVYERRLDGQIMPDKSIKLKAYTPEESRLLEVEILSPIDKLSNAVLERHGISHEYLPINTLPLSPEELRLVRLKYLGHE